jgi:hypothetical protein
MAYESNRKRDRDQVVPLSPNQELLRFKALHVVICSCLLNINVMYCDMKWANAFRKGNNGCDDDHGQTTIT